MNKDGQTATRFERLWLTEAVKRVETGGWLDDGDVLRHLAAAPSAQNQPEKADSSAPASTAAPMFDDEALLIRRSELLAQDHALVASLPGDIRRVSQMARATAGGLAFLVLLIGLGSAPAILGGGRVNIIAAWFALLGPHLISLLFWLLGMTFGLPTGGLSLGQLWRRAIERFAANHRSVSLSDALAGLLGPKPLKWGLSIISHGLWSVYFFGALSGLVGLMALHEYAFVWETTILSSGFFVEFVDVVGRLPALLGFSVPDASVVTALPSSEMARQAWSSWLLGSVLLYGLIPRLLLWALSWQRWRFSAHQLRLDLADPYYAQLLARLRLAIQPKPAIVEAHVPVEAAEPAQISSPQPMVPVQPLTRDHRPVLVGFELFDETPWPPLDLPEGIIALPKIQGHDEQMAVLDHLSSQRPAGALVVLEARVTADRGAFQFLRKVQAEAGVCRVLLLNESLTRPDKARNWREGLAESGFGDSRFDDLVPALAWLAATGQSGA